MTSSAPLIPGSTIGIVGGGQLGRMLAMVAHQFGYRVVVLTGGAKDTPAGVIAEVEIAAALDDETGIERFLSEADVITWEFENVELILADLAAEVGVPVRPAGQIIATTQDRQLEKVALVEAGVEVAPWQSVTTAEELRQAVTELGVPVIAKAARFGYDGKAQTRIDDLSQVDNVWRELGEVRLVIESVIDFKRELSVIVARGIDGEIVDHGVMENHHVNHILDTTIAPADASTDLAAKAGLIAAAIAIQWDLVGVMCVELFDTDDGLIVNEVAPRPHNSGHLTIEAARSSQFEQQLRAVCGLPLGDARCRPAAMVQLLGDLWDDGEPSWAEALDDPEIHLHLYGKTEAREGRKMGHITCVGDDPAQALQTALDARDMLSGR